MHQVSRAAWRMPALRPKRLFDWPKKGPKGKSWVRGLGWTFVTFKVQFPAQAIADFFQIPTIPASYCSYRCCRSRSSVIVVQVSKIIPFYCTRVQVMHMDGCLPTGRSADLSNSKAVYLAQLDECSFLLCFSSRFPSCLGPGPLGNIQKLKSSN